LASSDDFYNRKAILILGADLSLQQPFLGFQVRANQRHHAAKVYVITPNAVREDPSATRAVRAAGAQILDELAQMRDALAAEPELVIAFDDNIKGSSVRELVAFGDSLGIPVRYCCLVDYSNSRGAMDMGLLPDLLPGYVPAQPAGMTAEEMIAAPDLDVMWVVGSNPLEGAKKTWRKAFIVVQEMFLTETAQLADVVLPAASAYEKNGTVTNVCGEVQRLKKALNTMGAKPDLEIMGLIGREMGLAKVLGPWFAEQVFEEIRANVHGYNVSMPIIETGGAAQTAPVNGPINVVSRPDLIQSAHDTLFTSGNLGKYSKILNSVLERRMGAAPEAQAMESFNP
jgi:NADH-quinone oxidoreductase subunit G